jgi:ubiquitin C-terminal hydrolase
MSTASGSAKCGGLTNLGATCYLNTALQCLNHCGPFWKFMMSQQFPENTLIYELQLVVKDLSKYSLMPRRFVKAMMNRMKGFDVHEQNDIHEFLILFLDHLNKDIAKTITMTKQKLWSLGEYKKDDPKDVKRFIMDWDWYIKQGKEYSPLIDMFHGQTITQITCGHCENRTHNYETFCIIELPLSDKSDSLEDCIKHYFKDETLNGKETCRWTCDECKKQTKSEKVMRLWKLPPILIFTIKRFTGDLQKNNRSIKVPEKTNLQRHCVGARPSDYCLCAAAFHVGNVGSGHYFAGCKHKDKWYVFDDMDVRCFDHIDLDTSYMLFYLAEELASL